MRSSPVPTSQTIIAALRSLLSHLPTAIVAGVVYGSVAKGRHGSESDVDALLITDRPPAAPDHATVIEQYARFQVEVGLLPDAAYPLELFTLDECRSILGLPVRQAASGRRSARTAVDAWEVLYALATPHLVVIGEDVVADLRSAALRRLTLLTELNASGRATESAR